MRILDSLRMRLGQMRPRHVVGLIVAAAVIYGFINPTISEAVLSFLFGGIVPGTNVVIPPQIMILGAIGIIGLILLTLLIIWLIRVKDVRAASRHLLSEVEHVFDHDDEPKESTEQPARMTAETEYQIAQPVAGEPTAVPVAVRTPQRLRWQRRLQRLSGAIRRRSVQLLRFLRRRFGRVVATWHRFGRIIRSDLAMLGTWLYGTVRPWLIRAGRQIYVWSVQLLAMIIALSRLSYRVSRRALLRFGRFLHPYALRLDTWLELQYRRAAHTFQKTEAGQILTVTASEMRETVKRVLRQLHK